MSAPADTRTRERGFPGLDSTPAEKSHGEYAVRHASNAAVALLLLLVPAVAGSGSRGGCWAGAR